MQYITYKNLEKWTYSLIKNGTSHFKKAMQELPIAEQDEFIGRLIRGNILIEDMESIKNEFISDYCGPLQADWIENFYKFINKKNVSNQ